MGWFTKSLKGIIDPRASGESIIERIQAIYREGIAANPQAEPHQALWAVYLSRIATHGKNPQSEAVQAEAAAATKDFSCLAFPDNVEALGIAFINFERPDILQQCPDITARFTALMAPVREAQQRGQLEELYKRYNPTMAAMSAAPR